MGSINRTTALILTGLITISCLSLLPVRLANAQTHASSTPTIEWSRTYTRNMNYTIGGYNVTAKDRGSVVTQTSDGGYLVIGSLIDEYWSRISSTPHWGYVHNVSVAFVKTDSLGNIQWETTKAYSELPISPYLFATQTNGSIFLLSDPMNENVIKLDLEGNVQWKKNYGIGITSVLTKTGSGAYVTQTSDGNYVFLGSTFNADDRTSTSYLLKIDNQGNLIWKKILPTSMNLQISSVLEVNNESYAACGWLGNSAWFGVIDSNGNLIVNQTYTVLTSWLNQTYSAIDGWLSSMIMSKNGDFLVVGGIWSGGDNVQQVLVADIDSSGKLIWSHTFESGPSGNVFCSQIVDIGNCYVASGLSSLFGLDNSGNLLWTISGDALCGSISQIIPSGFGSFVAVGNTATSIWLAKYSDPTLVPESTPTLTPDIPRNTPRLDPIYYLIPISAIVTLTMASVLLYQRHRKTLT
jgi:hypothetical protein